MATVILVFRDDQYTLKNLIRNFLEEQDSTKPGIYEATCVGDLILFSNNVLEYDELTKAILTFDAEWVRTHRKYSLMGVELLDCVPEMFHRAYPNPTRPSEIASKPEDKIDLSPSSTTLLIY